MKKITEILAPGQELTLREAIDLMAEAYQIAKTQEVKKFNNDVAIAVGEEAFRAGFRAALKLYDSDKGPGDATLEQAAWDNFEPSEDIKELVDG